MAWIISAPRLSRLRPVVCRGKSTNLPGVGFESDEPVSVHERADVERWGSQEGLEIVRPMMKSPNDANRLGAAGG